MTRRFATAQLDIGHLVDLVDVARQAPSAGFSQGAHFLVLTGAALSRFWATSGAGEWFERVQPGVLAAPVVVVALADPHEYLERYAESDKAGHGLHSMGNWPVPYWYTDAAMAVQNLLLLLEEERLGGLWFGLFGDPTAALAELGVPAHVLPVGALAIGVRSAEDVVSGSPSRRERRPASEVVHVGHW